MAVGGGLLRGAARAGRGVLDLLLPPRCLGCGVEVTGEVGLCPACWSGLHLLAPPWCRCCGYPLPHALADQPLCERCAATPPAFDRARAALRYDARSARLVLGFKRGGRLEGVAQFARWMAQAGEELLADADLVLPVPLHRWRLVQRGFNQSALLAQRLARLTGRAWSPSVLLRHRRTASQQGLGAAERSENITAASFRVRRPERVAGQRVLLVDDVLTTGATLAACVTVLRRAGAARVDALTLARVAKLDETSI
jgi:ComF family protein